MRRLLIDANIYLDLYRFSNDDLEELRKLAELTGSPRGDRPLHQRTASGRVPEEWETVLAHAIKVVTDAKGPTKFPKCSATMTGSSNLTRLGRGLLRRGGTCWRGQ